MEKFGTFLVSSVRLTFLLIIMASYDLRVKGSYTDEFQLTSYDVAYVKCEDYCQKKCEGSTLGSTGLFKNNQVCLGICSTGCQHTGGYTERLEDPRFINCSPKCFKECDSVCNHRGFKYATTRPWEACMLRCITEDGKLLDADFTKIDEFYVHKTTLRTTSATQTTRAPTTMTESTSAATKTESARCDQNCRDKCKEDCDLKCDSSDYKLGVWNIDECNHICVAECSLAGGNLARIDDSKFKNCEYYACYVPCVQQLSRNLEGENATCILNCILRHETIVEDFHCTATPTTKKPVSLKPSTTAIPTTTPKIIPTAASATPVPTTTSTATTATAAAPAPTTTSTTTTARTAAPAPTTTTPKPTTTATTAAPAPTTTTPKPTTRATTAASAPTTTSTTTTTAKSAATFLTTSSTTEKLPEKNEAMTNLEGRKKGNVSDGAGAGANATVTETCDARCWCSKFCDKCQLLALKANRMCHMDPCWKGCDQVADRVSWTKHIYSVDLNPEA